MLVVVNPKHSRRRLDLKTLLGALRRSVVVGLDVYSIQGLRTRVRAMARSPRMPFEVRCRLLYWDKRRSWPTRHGVTFTEKLRWKMVKDRRPLLTIFADKVAVRDYVANIIGPEVLTQTLCRWSQIRLSWIRLSSQQSSSSSPTMPQG